MVSPEDKRAAIAHVRQVHGVSERRACGLKGQTRSTQRYRAKTKAEDGVRRRIAELAAERPRFGYRRLTALLKREGVPVWHGRVYRIAKELRLQVPRRKRKRMASAAPAPIAITRPNQRWGMDFVTDGLADGRSFRALAVVDHYTRECLVIEVDLSLPRNTGGTGIGTAGGGAWVTRSCSGGQRSGIRLRRCAPLVPTEETAVGLHCAWQADAEWAYREL